MRRRKFLQYGFMSSAIVLLSPLKLFAGITSVRETLALLQYDLVPQAKTLDINVVEYISSVVLRHSRISADEKVFLRNGVQWLNEEALKLYQQKYIALSPKKRELLLIHLRDNTRWGEDFLYDVTAYTLEGMLGDPIYGSNTQERGWQWLEFQAGVPRPKKAYL